MILPVRPAPVLRKSFVSRGRSLSMIYVPIRTYSSRLDSSTISKITEKEKELTGLDHPVTGGPTAKAQQHANEPITSQALHDITDGEKSITGGERVKGGPTSVTQSELSKSRNNKNNNKPNPTVSKIPNVRPVTKQPVMDNETISKIYSAEQKFTGTFKRGGGPDMVEGGPTDAAMRHEGERIGSEVLRDITEGEKKVSGVEGPVKGGPTSVAQGVLGGGRGRGRKLV